MLHHLQMQMVESGAKDLQSSQDAPIRQQQQINYTAVDGNSQNTSPMKQCQFFAFEEVPSDPNNIHSDQRTSDHVAFQLNDQYDEQPVDESPQFNAINEAGRAKHQDIMHDTDVPILQAPQIKKKVDGKKNLVIKKDDSLPDEQAQQEPAVPRKEDNLLSVDQSPGLQKNFQDQEFNDQDELQSKSVSPMIKPTPGKSMFNFGNFMD